MVLIGLLARKRSGKDTVADHLVKHYSFNKLSLADPLKEAISILFGFSDEQLYGDLKETVDPTWNVSPRLVLQWFGTEVFRRNINTIIPTIQDNFWVESFKVKYNALIKSDPNKRIVVADVRFPNEIRAIHELGGVVIKIERPDILDGDSHESEKNIDLINDYDVLLKNDGTIEQLYKKVNDMLSNKASLLV